jgi:predicted RNA binding protein YcfA (HicA-like mRNA interferase family)
MKTVSGKDMIRLLERRGWVLQLIHGSHHFYRSLDGATRLSIPVHGNRDLKPGFQRAIMRDAGLTDADL